MCKLNPDAGTCRGYNILWYYDTSIQRCQRFVYTGCDGNGNRFDTENECLDLCGPGVDTVVTAAPTQSSGGELSPACACLCFSRGILVTTEQDPHGQN